MIGRSPTSRSAVEAVPVHRRRRDGRTCAWRWSSPRSPPPIGGVLVRGEKGTAKSTMVRALAACSPPSPSSTAAASPATPRRPTRAARTARTTARRSRRARRGWSSCRSARPRTGVVGSLDLERALTEGVTDYEPGLLAAAHRGLLYVDEVNLLHDHLVDLLLDAAAMGRATSSARASRCAHAARFVLVGTMNPEEGELRPQLLDRFGLTVEVAAHPRPGAARRGRPAPAGLRRRPGRLRAPVRRRTNAELAERHRRGADGCCRASSCPTTRCARSPRSARRSRSTGMRADIVTARAAVAHAAWPGRDEVDHRRRPRRRPARAAAPPPPQPVRRARVSTRSSWTRRSRTPEPDDGPGPRGRPGRRRVADARDGRQWPAGRPASRDAPQGATPSRAAAGDDSRRRRRRPQHRSGSACRPTVKVHGVQARAGRRSRAITDQRSHRRRSEPAGRPRPAPAPARHGCGRGAAPERPRPRRAPGCCCAAAGPARARARGPRRQPRAVRASTRPARWPPGSGCARSRPRCCRCCSTPTSAATRSGWSPSAATAPSWRCRRRQSVDAAARRLDDAADRRAHAARGRPARGRATCCASNGCATRGAVRCWSSSPTAGPPRAPTPSRARRPRPDCATGVAAIVVDCETGPVRLGLAARPGRRTWRRARAPRRASPPAVARRRRPRATGRAA